MEEGWELIILCARCEDDYRDAGEKIHRDKETTVRDRCEMCGKIGLTFWIKRKKVPKKKQP